MVCIKKGLRTGAKNIIIFEDDIFFDRFSPAILKDCADFLSGTDHWNALFSGCLVSNSKKTENRSILRIKYRCLSHGYVLNRQFAESLIKTQWRGVPYDDVLKNWPDYLYAAYRIALDNELIVRKDVRNAILFATIRIVLLLIFTFPRPYLGLLSLLPAIAGAMTAFFVFSLIHDSASLMVLGFGRGIWSAIILISIVTGKSSKAVSPLRKI